MSSKKSLLPRFEFLIILVFFFSFMIWAVSRCNSTKQKYEQEVAEETDESEDSPAAIMAPQPLRDTVPLKPLIEANVERITPLYVITDRMNVRAAPDVNSRIVARLKLFDEVIFMNEVTDFKEQIEIENVMANEPWIKVKTQKGTEGWVYGAGLSYYKTKLESTE